MRQMGYKGRKGPMVWAVVRLQHGHQLAAPNITAKQNTNIIGLLYRFEV